MNRILRKLEYMVNQFDRVILWGRWDAPWMRQLEGSAGTKFERVGPIDDLPDFRLAEPERALVLIDRCGETGTNWSAMLIAIHRKLTRTSRVVLMQLTGDEARFPAVDDCRLFEVMWQQPIGQEGRHGATVVSLLRPIVPSRDRPTLSVVIPVRNERGNIRPAVEGLAKLEIPLELIFVEGHSTDGTGSEIERVVRDNSHSIPIRSFQQSGIGKADAVRLGCHHASGELIAILDADLTIAPEVLRQFYEAYCSAAGDFITGDRMRLPMERGAMRRLNRWGNKLFAMWLSRILETRIDDPLCGLKMFARSDAASFARWRKQFGACDPFGDFELLVPAATMGLRIHHIPVHYLARRYGATNIRRFRDGWALFRMVVRVTRSIRGANRWPATSSAAADESEVVTPQPVNVA
jgi:hypothetical protein